MSGKWKRSDKDELIASINQFKEINVLVLGDLMMDEYLWGDSSRLSPEAPVPIVDVKKLTATLGGAGNVVNNLTELGVKTVVCGVVGLDQPGEELLKKVSGQAIVVTDRPTTTKTRIMSAGQQMLRFDLESSEDIANDTEDSLIDFIKGKLTVIDAIIISDYGKGVVTKSLLTKLNDLLEENENNIIITIDPKSDQAHKYLEIHNYINAITPNHYEATDIMGEDLGIERAGNYILAGLGCEHVLITRGKDGMSLFDKREHSTHIDTVAREVFDVSGAGDTVISVFTLALVLGIDAEDAATLSNLAAGIVVGEIGTSAVTTEKLIKVVEELG